MSRLSQTARFLLILHGFLNIAQGLYSLTQPRAWAALAGPNFTRTPDQAVQAIGLGMLGIGWYQAIFAWQNNKGLLVATIPLRLVYAAITASWGYRGAVVYELMVWTLANCAAYL